MPRYPSTRKSSDNKTRLIDFLSIAQVEPVGEIGSTAATSNLPLGSTFELGISIRRTSHLGGFAKSKDLQTFASQDRDLLRKLCFYAFNVFASPRINFDHVALIDKDWRLKLATGFNFDRLANVG